LIAILDYGSGNLRSAERAFATAGKDVIVTSDRKVALEAEG
jgi:glutamine amidotransferase